MWTKSFSKERPLPVEPLSTDAYMVRRNIVEIEDGYTYDERIFSGAEAASYIAFKEENDALRAENEQMNDTMLAIVEMLDIASE